MTGKPIAPKGTKCPLWRKDVSKICHECEWYDKIEGTHPLTGARVDKWMCALNRMILMQTETAKQAYGTSDAVISFRNEVAKGREEDRANGARILGSIPIPPLPPRNVTAIEDQS